jgi:hypothetical protein
MLVLFLKFTGIVVSRLALASTDDVVDAAVDESRRQSAQRIEKASTGPQGSTLCQRSTIMINCIRRKP